MRTNGGADWQSGIMGNSASNGTGTYAPACYIAVTADTATPVATDTTLAGEVISGTLIRAVAIYAHTVGSTSYTLSLTLTSDQTIVLNKIGVFTASTGGVMVFETVLNSPVSMISGDQVLIVETVNV
jgi:hypothetical protein